MVTVTATAAGRRARRKPTSLALRSLAALVALVVLGSSLGQMAHFLLVKHTICAQHGELIELHGERADEPHHAPASAKSAEASAKQTATPAAEAEHDHCQLRARQQRELALPSQDSGALVPASVSVRQPAPKSASFIAAARSTLLLAPKTSPPCPAVG